MVDAPGRNRAMAFHGCTWLPATCSGTVVSAETWTWLPGLRRDWPSETSTSPAPIPLMMFNSLSWYSTLTGTDSTLSPLTLYT
ncbi:hypothetical protein D3C87_1916940 [compost metagenome]